MLVRTEDNKPRTFLQARDARVIVESEFSD